MDDDAKSGRSPASKHKFSLSVKIGQADAGRDGRLCLARPNSQTRKGLADHEQDWQPYPVDPYSAMNIHTYIQQKYIPGIIYTIPPRTVCMMYACMVTTLRIWSPEMRSDRSSY